MTDNFVVAVGTLVEVVFTDEDRKNLKVLAEELPRLRSMMEELIETLEIVSNNELMKSIQVSEKEVREGKLLSLVELLEELGFNEKEI